MFFAAYQAVLLPLLAEAFHQEGGKYRHAYFDNNLAAGGASKNEHKANPENAIRQAAASCMEVWCHNNSIQPKKLTKEEATTQIPGMHKECQVLSRLGSQTSSEDGLHFRFGSVITPSKVKTGGECIVSVKRMNAGSKTCAAVEIHIPASNVKGWLTLLQSRQQSSSLQFEGWVCIGAAFSDSTEKVLPRQFHDVMKFVWEGYCGANRACDGAAMAQVFHSTCRLTYVQDNKSKPSLQKSKKKGDYLSVDQTENNQDVESHHDNKDESQDEDDIVICPQSAFCDKVTHRYEGLFRNDLAHVPYQSLQDRPDVGRHDSLESMDFVTPDLCLVTLKVGHPPCLWTDYLTVCNLGGDASDPNWWIVHKSSCCQPYELTSDMQAALMDDMNHNNNNHADPLHNPQQQQLQRHANYHHRPHTSPV